MITKTEVKLMDQVSTPHGKWWVPFVWSCNLVRAARRQGRISDNYLMKTLLDVCTTFALFISVLLFYYFIVMDCFWIHLVPEFQFIVCYLYLIIGYNLEFLL